MTAALPLSLLFFLKVLYVIEDLFHFKLICQYNAPSLFTFKRRFSNAQFSCLSFVYPSLTFCIVLFLFYTFVS